MDEYGRYLWFRDKWNGMWPARQTGILEGLSHLFGRADGMILLFENFCMFFCRLHGDISTGVCMYWVMYDYVQWDTHTYTYLVGGFKHFLFSIIYGLSSFPLTFTFFKMVKTTNQVYLCNYMDILYIDTIKYRYLQGLQDWAWAPESVTSYRLHRFKHWQDFFSTESELTQQTLAIHIIFAHIPIPWCDGLIMICLNIIRTYIYICEILWTYDDDTMMCNHHRTT